MSDDLFKDLLEEVINIAETHNQQKGIWREKPVDLVTFFKEYLGETPYPGKQTELLEIVNKILNKDNLPENDPLREVTEVVAMWGKGSGKDFIISGIVAYVPYYLNCMYDPQGYFGFGKGEPIDIINIAKNAKQAENVFFTKLKARLRSCSWFKKVDRPPEAYNEYQEKKDTIIFYNNIRAFSGHSEAASFEGFNPLVAIFDEVGDFEWNLAEFCYDTLRSSAISRFGKRALLLFISYPRSADDFIMYKYKQGQDPEFPEVISSKGTTWEVNPSRKKEDFAMDYAKDPEGAKMRYESLTGDTLIWTAEGALRIDEVQDGAIIRTAHGAREVQMFIESGEKEVYRVITKEGYEIKGSINHPMKVYSNRKKPWDSKSFIWKTIGELERGDAIYLDLDNDLFGHGDMPKEMALLIGGLLSNGTFHKRKDGRKYVCWYFGKDRDLAELYKNAFEKVFKRSVNIVENSKRGDLYIRCDSQDVCEEFEKWGLTPANAHDKTIPSSIFKQPKEVIIEFLKAYVDADGYVSKNGIVTITSCNLKMLKQLQQLLLMLGIRSRITKDKENRKSFYKNKEIVSTDSYRLYLSKTESFYFHKLIKLNLPRKRERQNIITYESLRPDRRHQQKYAIVEKVEYVGKEKCYDLWVEPENEFIANGMAVHNCVPPAQRGGFFQYPERIDQCVKPGKVNPCTLEEIVITETLHDGQERHFIGYDVELFRETLELDPSKTYYLGLDGGLKSDSFALSLFHAEVFYEEVLEGGEAVEKARNKPVEVLLIEWKPDQARRIPVSVQNVIDIVEVICQKVFVKKALMDGFNSGALLQKLAELGVEAEDKVFSNPFQLSIYTQFKNLAYTGHLELLDYEQANEDMKHIQLVNGNKIDHEKGRSKDTCDARCAAVYLCATDEPEEITNWAMPVILGAVRQN